MLHRLFLLCLLLSCFLFPAVAFGEHKGLYVSSLRSFYIDKGGILWGWGGLAGLGYHDAEDPVPILPGVKDFARGAGEYLLVRQDGTLWQMTSPGIDRGITLTQLTLPDGVSVSRIFSFNAGCFALDENKNLWGWGDKTASDLLPGPRKARTKPRILLSGIKLFVYDFSGHLLALLENGELLAWGANTCGALGDGTTRNSNKPRKVLSGKLNPTYITALATRPAQSMAITDNGELWSWGKSFDAEYYAYDTLRSDDSALAETCDSQNLLPQKNDDWHDVAGIMGHHHSTLIYYVKQKDGKLWKWAPYLKQRELMFENVEAMTDDRMSQLVLKKDGTLWFWKSLQVNSLKQITFPKDNNIVPLYSWPSDN